MRKHREAIPLALLLLAVDVAVAAASGWITHRLTGLPIERGVLLYLAVALVCMTYRHVRSGPHQEEKLHAWERVRDDWCGAHTAREG